MSTTRLAIAVALLALMSAGASAQVGIRIGGGGIGLGFVSPPLFGGRDRPGGVEHHRAPQRSERVRRKQRDDDDDVKTAKKTPASQELKEAKAQNENSSISALASDKDKNAPVAEKTGVAESGAKFDNENSTIASAESGTIKSDPVEASVTTAGTSGNGKTVATCRRYLPTVGETITVPCD